VKAKMSVSYSTCYQQRLPKYPIEYFQEFTKKEYGVIGDALDFTSRHLWLGYLCCLGEFDVVLAFLSICKESHRDRYINERSNEFWNGTLLHMILYWNTGEHTITMYKKLRELGAVPIENMYDNYPWENSTQIWCAPTLRTSCGHRDHNEFAQLYQTILDWELEHYFIEE